MDVRTVEKKKSNTTQNEKEQHETNNTTKWTRGVAEDPSNRLEGHSPRCTVFQRPSTPLYVDLNVSYTF